MSNLEIIEEVVIDGDVHFSGRLDGRIHRFVIFGEALDQKAHHDDEDSSGGYDRLHVFKDHKEEIAGLAEKLIDLNLAFDPVYTIDSEAFNR